MLKALALLMTLNGLQVGEIEKPVCFPFGVAQPDGRTGYLFNFNKSIDAIDLQTGKRLWRTNLASRPLIAYDETLIAGEVGEKPNIMRILRVSRDGRATLLATVEFPPWVNVQPIDGFNLSITSAIRNHGAEELLLEWRARSKYVDGANPPPFIEHAANRQASGRIAVRLRNGVVKNERLDSVESDTFLLSQKEKDLIQRINEEGVTHACLFDQRIYYQVQKLHACGVIARTSESLQFLWEYRLPCPSSPRPPPLRK